MLRTLVRDRREVILLNIIIIVWSLNATKMH